MAGTSYTRQSTLTDGDTITASLFNAEYNQLVTAFSYAATGTTGHQHDGGAGEGGNIEIIGDQDFLNKIVVDSTNNRWSVFVEVGGSAVEQVRIEDGVVYPVTDSDVDLGTNALRFKDAYIDSLTATGNLTIGGNIDVDGIVEFDGLSGTGSVTVTDIADEDNMSSNSATKLATQQSIKAYVDSQVTAQDLDLTDGSTSISIDLDSEALSVLGGTGVTSTASGNGVTLAIDSTVTTLTGSQTLTNKTLTSPDVNTPDIDGGTIDGTVIGGATAAAGSFTTVGATGNITVGGTVDGRDVATDGSKLDGIEASATADQTNAEIRTAVEAASDSNVFTDADHSKLNAIEASATADQSNAEIRTAVEAASDSNVFTDADHSKLNAIEASATADQSNAEIRAAVEAATDSNVFTDADHSKLNAIEASADVTDTANVTAAGALMDSELTAIASVKALNQGVATGDSPTFVDVTATSLDISGNIDVDGVTNLDVVDIDGAVDMASTLQVDGAATFTTEITANGGIALGDNDKATFGASDDLQIYHDGGNSYIKDAGTGTLNLQGSTQVLIAGANGTVGVQFIEGGGVNLRHNNANKLATASGGITVTGEVAATSLDISGDIDVDGTTNLDVVDIDGAVDMATTALFSKTAYGANDSEDFYRIKFKDQGGVANDVGIGQPNVDSIGFNFTPTANAGGLFFTGGTSGEILRLTSSGAIFNESSADKDFRVASNTNTHALFVEGSGNNVGIGTSTLTSSSGYHTLSLNGSSGGQLSFQTGGTGKHYMFSSATDLNMYSSVDGALRFSTNNFERLEMSSSATIFNDIGADVDFRVESNGNANMLFVDGGNNRVGIGMSANSGSILNANGHIRAENSAFLAGREDASLPAFSFHDDTDTGMFNVASNILAFSTAGTERFRIAADGSLSTPTAGTSNVRFGVNAGNSIASGGNYNVVVGDEAGTALTTGDGNVAVGFEALQSEDTTSANTAIGHQALKQLNAGATGYNTAVGFTAGIAVTTGVQNTLVGGLAGDAITTASNNAAFGYSALGANTTGILNTAIGSGTLFSNTTASNNTAVGTNALLANTTGASNVAVGTQALDANTTASNNTSIGFQALTTNTTGSSNTAVGQSTLSTNSTGASNVAVGALALDANTTASSNVAVGNGALGANTVGSYSVAIGFSALAAHNPASASASFNTAVGTEAGTAVTTGVNNTLIGGLAGDAITTASNNTAVGKSALTANTTGASNVAVGYATGAAVTTGTDNTFIGSVSGAAITTGIRNTAVGSASLDAEVAGHYSTALGFGALSTQSNSSSADVYNTACGYLAGQAVTTGVQNTFIGGLAGDAITVGSNNTAIGFAALSSAAESGNTAVGQSALIACTDVNNTAVGDNAGYNVTEGTQNTLIGAQVEAEAAGSNNCIGLGFNIVAGAGYTTLGIDTSDIRAAHGNVTWATVSDQRYKKDIVDSTAGLSFINALQPRTFKYKNLGELPETFNAYEADSTEVFKNSDTNHGFIAQEVKAAIDADSSIKDGFRLWDDREDGSQEVAEAALIPILVKAIQELTARITTLEG